MKKGLKYLFLILSLFVGLGLVACDNSTTGAGSGTTAGEGAGQTGEGAGTGEGGGSQGGQTQPTYKELDDCDFPVGKYMINDIVYDYNKTDKKVIATKYESYSAYKNNDGVKQFETTVNFVEKGGIPSVHFKDGDYDYFFLVKEGKTTYVKKKNAESSGGLISVDKIVEPTYGKYVSSICEQYKVDSDGERIVKDGGGYEKENFYLFLELTETSLKVYVSDNNTTHGDTPLYSLDNYVLTIVYGYICFSVKHPNGNYSCSFRVMSDTVIHCTNSAENLKGGDYSMSGNLTKIA